MRNGDVASNDLFWRVLRNINKRYWFFVRKQNQFIITKIKYCLTAYKNVIKIVFNNKITVN